MQEGERLWCLPGSLQQVRRMRRGWHVRRTHHDHDDELADHHDELADHHDHRADDHDDRIDDDHAQIHEDDRIDDYNDRIHDDLDPYDHHDHDDLVHDHHSPTATTSTCGRWRPFQRPLGGRPPLHARHDRRATGGE